MSITKELVDYLNKLQGLDGNVFLKLSKLRIEVNDNVENFLGVREVGILEILNGYISAVSSGEAKLILGVDEDERKGKFVLLENFERGISHQEIARKDSWSAYVFARDILGADIEKCQEAACKNPEHAYRFAKDIRGANIEKCCEAACKHPYWAYYFARFIPGANIEKCQESACTNPEYAYYFARFIPGANIEKCRKACKGTKYAYYFAKDIPGANIEKCRKACKGTKYAF